MKNTILSLISTAALAAILLVVACKSKSASAPPGSESASTSEHAHSGRSHDSEKSNGVLLHAQADCPTGKACFLCDPSQREKGRLWCKEHNRYEDRCWICHRDLEDKSRPFCSEHGVYEDECLLCHPEVGAGGKTGSPPSEKVLMCNEHGVPEHECAICHPDLASGLKPGEALKVNLTSKNSAKKAGVVTAMPTQSSATPSITAYCVVDYNQDQVTMVTPLVQGVVRQIKATFGQKVKQGDVLAILNSPELAEQKNDYLAALAMEKVTKLNYDRKKRPEVRKVTAAQALENAEAAWQVAKVKVSATRQKLLNFDLTEADIQELEETQKPTSLLPIRAPFGGTIVNRKASVGKLATPGSNLFTLADLCSMWLELSIPASHASKLAVGMKVEAQFDSIPEEMFTAELIWIDSEINPKTRLARARALIELPPSRLRKGLFGKAKIHLDESQDSLSVPLSSIQRIDDTSFVFIQKSQTLFAATRVTLAEGSDTVGRVAVVDGLKKSDRIVVVGSYIMRSEFLKSQLGAGCVDD